MGAYSNLFSRYQPLHGKDWVRSLPPEDKAVFVEIGLEAGDHGKLGGKVRAMTANRDNRGRFLSKSGTNNVKPGKNWDDEP